MIIGYFDKYRYTKALFHSEIKDTKKSYYSSLMTDPMEAQEDFIYNKPYNGMYTKQPDYYYFKNEEIE